MSTLNDEDRENLAAFLDGELDEETAQALEAKLSRDPSARQEVDALREAWSMLDYLPRPEPNANFTHRTMERIATGARVPETAKIPSLRKPLPWRSMAGWAAAILVALGAGVVTGHFLWRNEPEEIEAPDRAARLAAIQVLRDQQWLRQQPKAYRDKLETLKGPERAQLIRDIREQEQRRQQEWAISSRFWNELSNPKFQPALRASELPRETQEYVNEYLKPMLGKEEKERLAKSEGHWPDYLQTLVELADRHPPALPGHDGPRTFAELPIEVQKRLKGKFARLNEGNYPAFAIALSDLAFKRNVILPHELWPTHEKCLSPAMLEFFNTRLQPLLTPDETRHLAAVKGKWPEYPQTLQDLARNHKLQPPWLTLPGPRERWDNYRVHDTR